MIATSLGDRAQLMTGLRHNADIRTRLNALTEQMASGRPADMVAHLRGDTAPLSELDRRLSLADAFGAAARETGSRLDVMQASLERMEAARLSALKQIVIPSQVGERAVAAQAATAAFEDLAVAMNARWGDGSLFAGTDTAGPALAGSGAMLADIRMAVAGATTAAEVALRLDTWFDDPAGGFATMAYQGGLTDMTRAVDVESTVRLSVRADHPALRGLLKAAALGALAADPALPLPPNEGDALVARSRDALLSAALPLTEARAELGQAQAFTEEAAARHAARGTAWGILRNELTLADPFTTASEIEALRLRLETHYEITGRLNGLSLVTYLR